MKLGIISDTHDRSSRTSQAVTLLMKEGIEALVHCGDVTTPSIIHEFTGIPSYFVYGNNDWDEAGLARAIDAIGGVCLGRGGEIELGGRRIAVTHGDLAREVQRLVKNEPDILLYGHTHQTADVQQGATRFINPGALHRAPRWTVAVLDLESLLLRFIDVGSSA